MTVGFPKSRREARALAFSAALAEVHLPAFAIDVQAAEIIAANADGAAALGLFSYADFPVAMDAHMPALERLRETVASSATGDITEELVFDFSGETRTLNCRVTRDTVLADAGVVLIQVLDDDTDKKDGAGVEPATAPAQREEPAPEPLPAPAPAAIDRPVEAREAESMSEPEDAETLKRIARRIREGFLPHDRLSLNDQLTAPPQEAPAPEAPASTQHAGQLPRRAVLPPLSPEDLSKLAHELKTPIAAIAAAAEIMRDERLGQLANARYKDYAAAIYDSAEHALSVIGGFLETAGGDPGARTTHDRIDLNELANRVVSTMQPLAEERGLKLTFVGYPGHPAINADPTALRQVLLNLLTNAIKFTPAGGDVRVATGILDDGRTFLVVRDTGTGMATAPPPADDATSNATGNADTISNGNHGSGARLGQGLGIGLSIVRRFVRDMGARLEIDSVPGNGTAVLIVFSAHTNGA